MKKLFAPMIRCGVGVAIVWSCLLSLAQGQQATTTIRRNIAALTDEASTVIHGKVISATVEPDPNFANLTTVLVSMNVQEVLKGSAEKTFTFRQFVWDFRERSNAAGYVKGQEMLLFLRPPSRYGLTSPAGLQQGRFIVQRDATGKAAAINGIGNQGLLDNLSQGARSRGVVLPSASQKIKPNTGNALDLESLSRLCVLLRERDDERPMDPERFSFTSNNHLCVSPGPSGWPDINGRPRLRNRWPTIYLGSSYDAYSVSGRRWPDEQDTFRSYSDQQLIRVEPRARDVQ